MLPLRLALDIAALLQNDLGVVIELFMYLSWMGRWVKGGQIGVGEKETWYWNIFLCVFVILLGIYNVDDDGNNNR